MRAPLLIIAAVAIVAGIATGGPVRYADAQAATINVTTLSDVTANDGQCTLREALANAADGAATHADCESGGATNEIVIPAGTILLDEGELVVDGDVLIRGQGMDETSIFADGVRGFLIVSAGTVVIQDLEIRDGGGSEGAGIRHNGGDLTVRDVRLKDNSASNMGGAIFSDDTAGTLLIAGSEIMGNEAAGTGGGLSSDSEAHFRMVSIVNSTFSGNKAPGSGGAIFARDGGLQISGSTLSNNEATSGGAVHVSGVAVTIETTTFEENIAFSAGGALSASTATIDIDDARFLDNEAEDGGAIVLRHSLLGAVEITMTNSLVRGNVAANRGGAFLMQSGDLVVEDTLFASNRADFSGATIQAFVDFGAHANLTLRRVAVNSGSSPSGGAGVLFQAPNGTGNVLVDSSNFWGTSSSQWSSIGIDNGMQGTIINSTFSASTGNVVRIQAPGTHLDIINSTFVGDYSGNVASNYLVTASHDATITMHNSVLVLAREAACREEGTGTITGTGNADDDGSCPGAINVPGDIFLPIDRVSGGTWSHAPVPGAPIIGAANPAFCPEVDQHGRLRKAAGCDIGAVEFYFTLFATMKARDGFAE